MDGWLETFIYDNACRIVLVTLAGLGFWWGGVGGSGEGGGRGGEGVAEVVRGEGGRGQWRWMGIYMMLAW